IYDMVVRRFISVFYPPAVYEQTVMEARAGKELFAARGRTVKEEGWHAVYAQNGDLSGGWEEEDEEPEEKKIREQLLRPHTRGERLQIDKASLTEGKTKPPARFTEATLLAAMENPVKYMESRDAAAARTLGETGGLGTVATRADIIEKL